MHKAFIKEGRTNVSEVLSIRLDSQRRYAFRLNGLQLEFYPEQHNLGLGKKTQQDQNISRMQQVPTGVDKLQCAEGWNKEVNILESIGSDQHLWQWASLWEHKKWWRGRKAKPRTASLPPGSLSSAPHPTVPYAAQYPNALCNHQSGALCQSLPRNSLDFGQAWERVHKPK